MDGMNYAKKQGGHNGQRMIYRLMR